MKSTFPLLLAGVFLLPMGACATHGQQSPDSYSSAAARDQAPPATGSTATTTAGQDSSIAAKIKSEMAAQNVASLPDISVNTDSSGGVVLSGTAQSQEDIDKTMSIARSTAGVTSVTNDIKVKSQG